MAPVGKGAEGDLVVWAQEHLISAGDEVAVDGDFGKKTLAAVRAFQADHGLSVDGIIGPETWLALLGYPPARIVFGTREQARRATAASTRGSTSVRYAPVPESASRPAKRDEIAGAGGAGGSDQRR
jgi:peptidoglycan hydrolase-like protein with peptidoglycan-binding domain